MEEKKQRCIFFNTCGAYIVQEKLGKNWCARFCFADCEECDYHKYRKSPAFQKHHEQTLSKIGASFAEILKWP